MLNELKGVVASKNKNKIIEGEVFLSNYFNKEYNTEAIKGKILVCIRTDYGNIELLKNFKAIVTEYGGILSHAAIISREFKIPCIVGIKDVTKILKSSQKISLDFEKGIIKI
jgi:phosphohistidine swiveling domain-containing protein